MRQNRSLVRWLVSLLLATIALAGCGGSQSKPAANQPASTPSTPAPASKEPVVLKVGYQKHPIQDHQIDRMVKWGEKNGVKVEPNAISYEVYVQKMSANLLAPKGEYDIIWNNDDWGQLWGPRLDPLTDVPGLADVDPFDLKPFLIDGKTTAVPFVLTAGAFWYRSDLVKPEEVPKTWEELVTVGERLMKEGKVKYAFAGGMKYPHSYFTILWSMWSNGANLFDPVNGRFGTEFAAAKWTPAVTKPEYIEVVEFWHDMIHTKKLVPPGLTGYTRADADALFMNGEIAFTAQDTTMYGTYNDPAKSKIAGKAVPFVFPKGPKGKAGPAWADGWAWSVPKNSNPAAKDAAKKLIGYMATDADVAAEQVKKTGGIPASKKNRDALQQTDPLMKVFLPATTLAPGRHYSAYYFPEWPEMHTALADFTVKALTGSKADIPKVMKDLDAELRKIAPK